MKRSLTSSSAAETKQFAEEFARALLKKRAAKTSPQKSAKHGATVVALQGDLGAGKTTFTQGFARALGIKRRLISPTFVIMRRYPIRAGRGRARGNLYHIDAYRFKKPDALEALGFKEILADPTAIVLIEWPENVKKLLPRGTTWLKFRHGKKENERAITIL